MAATDVENVLKLKHQLKGCCEGNTVLKILKKLQKLDITLDVLAETGIGKVVNFYRKNDQAGKVAKMLVNRWKALLPKYSVSEEQSKGFSSSEQPSREIEQMRGSHLSESTNSRKKKSDSVGRKPTWNIDVKSEVNPSKHKTYFDEKKKKARKELGLNQSLPTRSLAGTEHINQESKKTAKNVGVTKKQQSTRIAEMTASKSAAGQREKKGDSCRKDKRNKTKEKMDVIKSQDCLEKPSMPFEAYLSYDLEPLKRRKCFSAVKNPKRLKISQVKESCVKSPGVITDPLTMASSVMDFLNVPLPTSFPECEDVSQYQYFNDKKAERKVMDAYEETPIFVGQRLKNKMQVYSGSKITYLPTMLTLYQQCIRALQNNIDSLYEIGGVPFEILEPVLDRCTPEQLLRIEEHNPVYIGVMDHLWEKHCQKDFRNAQLQEYESWRELYLRMSEERERKLKQLTKNIVNAHSGKPKGRQVKMAFIDSTAKPPRNVRIQQEIHGTAGLVTLHSTDKPSSVKTYESRGRSNFSETPKPSNSSGQTQDPRKIKRVAPMMAKSLKAFKKQLSRR